MTDSAVVTQFTTDAKAFATAVKWVAKGVALNANVPEYETIYLKLAGSTLSMTGYNGASLYTHTVDVSRTIGDEEDYTAVVHGGLLGQVVNVLNRNEITVEAGKKNLLLRSGRSKFTVPLMNTARLQSPAAPAEIGTVLSGALSAAIPQVAVAASTDETLASLTAILFEFRPEKKTIRLVACDRFQLAIKEIHYEPKEGALPPGEDGAPALRVVVPARALKKLVTGLNDNELYTLHGEATGSYFGISSPHTAGFVNTFEDDFVKYERLLSVQFPHRLTVDAAELKAAVNSIVSIGRPGQNVFLQFKEEGITVHNVAKDSSIDVDAVMPEGVADEFGFSSAYLSNALGKADGPTVSLLFDNPRKPAVLHATNAHGDDEPQWTHLVMPIRG